MVFNTLFVVFVVKFHDNLRCYSSYYARSIFMKRFFSALAALLSAFAVVLIASCSDGSSGGSHSGNDGSFTPAPGGNSGSETTPGLEGG